LSRRSHPACRATRQDIIEAATKLIAAELRKRKKIGMTMAEMIAVTGLDREQVKYVTKRLRDAGVANPSGRGRYAKWALAANG